MKGMSIFLDYQVNPEFRYGYGKPPHPQLQEILNRRKSIYQQYLLKFLSYQDDLLKIATQNSLNSLTQPNFINDWIPGLDAVSLYGLLRLKQPKLYLEVGSGQSTKFAKKAIEDGNLKTQIISIDPNPRSEIDLICNQIIRQPVETLDLAVFDQLEAGDILFVDNSHRVFTNSDAVVVFLDILPRLKSGVIVHFHDIFLPYDYPPDWKNRFYSEQYVLAAYLLAGGNKFNVILPNFFITLEMTLNNILKPLWNHPQMQGVSPGGGSFWIEIN